MAQVEPPDGDSVIKKTDQSARATYLVHADEVVTYPERLDLFRLLGLFSQGRWLIVATTSLFLIVGALNAFLAKSWYRAEVVMVSVSQGGRGGLSAQLGQLGGLAGLAGIAGLGNAAGSTAEPLAVLKSREFSADFIQRHGLEEKLQSVPMRLFAGAAPVASNIGISVEIFQEHVLKVSEDNKKGLVTLAIEWTDPQQAAAWANDMAADVNERLRRRAIAEASANIAYLKGRLSSESIVSIQQALGRLVEAEMQNLMIAQSRSDYAFRVVDRAQVPFRQVRPAKAKIIALSLLLGFGFSVFALLIKEALRQSRERRHAYSVDA